MTDQVIGLYSQLRGNDRSRKRGVVSRHIPTHVCQHPQTHVHTHAPLYSSNGACQSVSTTKTTPLHPAHTDPWLLWLGNINTCPLNDGYTPSRKEEWHFYIILVPTKSKWIGCEEWQEGISITMSSHLTQTLLRKRRVCNTILSLLVT